MTPKMIGPDHRHLTVNGQIKYATNTHTHTHRYFVNIEGKCENRNYRHDENIIVCLLKIALSLNAPFFFSLCTLIRVCKIIKRQITSSDAMASSNM